MNPFAAIPGLLALQSTWAIVLVFVGGVVAILARRLFRGGSIESHASSIEWKPPPNLTQLKATGRKISLDLEHCQFIDNSYSHEVNQDLSPAELLSHPSMEIQHTENVNQCALAYTLPVDGKTERFVQSFPFTSDTLKFYVLNHNITLYIDPYDIKRYYFDLQR